MGRAYMQVDPKALARLFQLPETFRITGANMDFRTGNIIIGVENEDITENIHAEELPQIAPTFLSHIDENGVQWYRATNFHTWNI